MWARHDPVEAVAILPDSAEIGAPDSGGVVLAMRHATRAAHEHLEANLGLMSPALTPATYGSLLRRFASLYEPLEAAIGTCADACADPVLDRLDLPARRKLPALRDDLNRLGRGRRTCVDPTVGRVPGLASVEAAIGALYVCEGATLGGQKIAPHVRRVLGDDAPVSFFDCYGGAAAVRWADYRHVANAVVATPAGRQRAVAAASDVFDWFAEVLLA